MCALSALFLLRVHEWPIQWVSTPLRGFSDDEQRLSGRHWSLQPLHICLRPLPPLPDVPDCQNPMADLFLFFYLQNLHRPFWISWTTLYLDFRRLLPHRKAVWDREMTLWLPTILKVVEPNMMMIFARSSIARSRSICSLYLIVTVVNTVTCSCTVKMSRKKYKHHITGKINILISKWGKN